MVDVLQWLNEHPWCGILTLVLVVVVVFAIVYAVVWQGRPLTTKWFGIGGFNAKVEDKPSPLVEVFSDPFLIVASKRNHQQVRSDFILWPECTLMLWVLVPEKGRGLRDAPHNRYLLAHFTRVEGKFQFYNQFSLGYTAGNRWKFEFTNNMCHRNDLGIMDTLNPGWHHFAIAWNPFELVFRIDNGDGGQERLDGTYLSSWPGEKAKSVFLGAWVSCYPESYCETRLYRLQIENMFLCPSDPVVRQHYSARPSAKCT